MASIVNFRQLVLLSGSIDPVAFRALITEQAQKGVEQYVEVVDSSVRFRRVVDKLFQRKPKDWLVGSVEYPVP